MTVKRFLEDTQQRSYGVIKLWSGDPANPPAGWALCDGNNGTPNLLGRFVRGTNVPGNVGVTGGQDSYNLAKGQLPAHNHSATADTNGSHDHTIGTWGDSPDDWISINNVDKGDDGTTTDGSHSHPGSTSSDGSNSSVNNLPAYHELVFLMRL